MVRFILRWSIQVGHSEYLREIARERRSEGEFDEAARFEEQAWKRRPEAWKLVVLAALLHQRWYGEDLSHIRGLAMGLLGRLSEYNASQLEAECRRLAMLVSHAEHTT